MSSSLKDERGSRQIPRMRFSRPGPTGGRLERTDQMLRIAATVDPVFAAGEAKGDPLWTHFTTNPEAVGRMGGVEPDLVANTLQHVKSPMCRATHGTQKPWSTAAR